MKKIAISDIHGCAATFEALLEQIALSKTDELYLLGDFIDRGPDSKGVIDKVWEMQDAGYQVFCLRGNHEQILLNARHDPRFLATWLRHGGKEALASFRANDLRDIPKRYKDWMEQLPYYFEVDEYILVHAGFNFEIPDPLEDEHAMLWERYWYGKINRDWLQNRIIIHGHTPTPKPTILEQSKHLDTYSALVIDNGCVFDRPDLGHLVAMDLGSRDLFFQKRVD